VRRTGGASSLAKSLFQRGADFTAAMVFMFASTNLVAELGIAAWLLIGWQFTLAEFAGGAIMIVLLGLLPGPAAALWKDGISFGGVVAFIRHSGTDRAPTAGVSAP